MNKKIKWLSLVICVLFIGTAFSGVIGSRVDNTQSKQNKTVQENAIMQLQLKRNDNTAITSRGCIQNIVSSLQPTVVITSPDNGSVFTEPGITLTGYAVDEIGIDYINYTHEWEEGANCSSWTIDPPVGYYEFAWEFVLYEGWNRIKVTAGNVNEMYGCDEITVYYNPGEEDTEPPVVVIGYPPDGSTFFDPIITVTGYATDNVGITIIGVHHEWEGGEASTSRDVDPLQTHVSFEVVNLELRLNWNRITVFAEDVAENIGSDEIIVYYIPEEEDTEPPIVVIEYPENGSIFIDPIITVIGHATDNVGITFTGYTHEWEGGEETSSNTVAPPLTPVDIVIEILNLHEGWNKITFFAEDEAGNRGEENILVTYLVDTTPPLIEKIKPTNAIYVNDKQIMPFIFPVIIGSVTIEVNAMDNETGVHKVDFYIDDEIQCGDAKEPYLWKWGGTYFGFHTIKIVAYDNASNRGEHEEKVFIINRRGTTTEFPKPVITTPVHEQAVGGMIKITAVETNNATDITYCKFSCFDGTEWYEIDTDYGYVIDSDKYKGKWFAYWHTNDLTPGYCTLRAEMENTESYIGYNDIEVLVEEQPVIAVDIIEYDPEIGRTMFDASESYDPDGSITNYTWTFRTYPNITTSYGEIVTYFPPENYTNYTLTLEVYDNHNVYSTEGFVFVSGVLYSKFDVELDERDKKEKLLEEIRKEKREIREDIDGAAYLPLAKAEGHINLAKKALQSARLYIIAASISSIESRINLFLSEAAKYINKVIENITSAISKLEEVKNKIKESYKDDIQDNIHKLKAIRFQMHALSAKIWLIRQIGSKTHGWDIPFPDDIIVGEDDDDDVYYDDDEEIHMGDNYADNVDVFLHELDHHFMHKKDGWNMPGGRHVLDEHLKDTWTEKGNKGHKRKLSEARQLAWSEGWATFSSAAKRNDPIMHASSKFEWDLENGKTRRWDATNNRWGPWQNLSTDGRDGLDDSDSEVAVADLLWDLFDGACNGVPDSDGDAFVYRLNAFGKP